MPSETSSGDGLAIRVAPASSKVWTAQACRVGAGAAGRPVVIAARVDARDIEQVLGGEGEASERPAGAASIRTRGPGTKAPMSSVMASRRYSAGAGPSAAPAAEDPISPNFHAQQPVEPDVDHRRDEQVRTCDTIRPPTTVTPSGWRKLGAGAGAYGDRQRAERAQVVVIMMGGAQKGRIDDRHLGRRALGAAHEAKSTIMMAFFLTIPISMMTPDHGDDAQIHAEQHRVIKRTNAGPTAGRQDGERMDEVFGRGCPDDVDDQHGGEQHMPWLATACWKTWACPRSWWRSGPEGPLSAARFLDRFHRLAERHAPAPG